MCLRWYREREERERESGRQRGRYVEWVKWECVESVSLSDETVDKKKGEWGPLLWTCFGIANPDGCGVGPGYVLPFLNDAEGI